MINIIENQYGTVTIINNRKKALSEFEKKQKIDAISRVILEHKSKKTDSAHNIL